MLIAKSQLLKTANPVASQALAAAALDAVCPDFANNGISLVHNQDWHGGMMQILAESDTVAHLLKTKFAGLPEPLVHYWHWLNTYAMQRKDQDLIQKLSQASQKYWQEVDNLSLRTYLVENQAYSETFLSALNTTFDPQKKQVFFNNFLNIKASLLWLSQAYLKQKKPLTARQTQELLKLYQNLLLTNPPQNVLLAAAEIWQLVPNDQIRTAILSLKGQTPVQQTSLAHLGLIKKQGLVQRQNQTERLIKESRKNGL